MSIKSQADLEGMKAVSDAVSITLCRMRAFARPGMSTRELDDYGGRLLAEMGARSAPVLTYGFPGHTCISVNTEIAHGIPSDKKILQEGDLVNIDVSAELNGYWADNGGSFVLGPDIHGRQRLVDTSRQLLREAIGKISDGVRLSEIGRLIETGARQAGYTVIRNLAGHGVGRSLHEPPEGIVCFHDRYNRQRFRKDSVVAIETFISTGARYAQTAKDGWTLFTRDGSMVAQHEHTIVVTDGTPVILTEANEIWS